jgi:hypothetical protein
MSCGIVTMQGLLLIATGHKSDKQPVAMRLAVCSRL